MEAGEAGEEIMPEEVVAPVMEVMEGIAEEAAVVEMEEAEAVETEEEMEMEAEERVVAMEAEEQDL